MSAPLEEHTSPAERLALSRERMRQLMLARMPQAGPAHGAGGLPSWLDGLADIPLVGAIVDAVRGWWAQHPMHLAVLVAGDAGKTLIRPLAQRHPIGLVVAALLVGGVLARARPWRHLVKPAIFAGLLTQIVSKVVSHVPVESWISAISSLTSPPQPQADPATPPPARAPEAEPGVHLSDRGSQPLH